MLDVDDSVVSKERASLHEIEVRRVEAHEVERWLALMRQHHYLSFGKSAGKRVLHVATLRGEWVALLCWAAAALHVKCRDEWIGWDSIAKRHRLRLVTNNTRFLVLPGWQRRNLASRVLSLSVKRLARDWRACHGYAVVLAETFVDPKRFGGTCYRAAGWSMIGMTEDDVRPFALSACTRVACKSHDQDGPARQEVHARRSAPAARRRRWTPSITV
jgi:GNAT superfamily N-acetyltransferase